MQRKLFLIIISILILSLSILGITYAFMRPQVEKKKEKSNITINACAKIRLVNESKSITLENSYPMDDEMGLETDPYEFTITSTCEDYVGFNLYLTSLSDNEIEDNNIHFAITSKNKEVLKEGILGREDKGETEFNSDELNELDLELKGSHKNIYKVYSNSIPFQGESNYQLYLWVDKDAGNETMDQSFKVGLSIKSYNRKETGAEKLISTVKEDKTLYYHDEQLEGGARDLSYRYAGSFEEVKNFVCLDGEVTTTGSCASDTDLYRIIGLFKNDLNLYEMKLIKYDYATSNELGQTGAYNDVYSYNTSYYKGIKDNLANIGGYYWTSSTNEINEWAGSTLRETNLNEYYLNTYLKGEKHIDTDNLIENHTWSLNGYSAFTVTPKVMYDNEMDKAIESIPDYPTQTKNQKNKIGLMYASDYGYAASPSSTGNYTTLLQKYINNILDNNWMHMGLYEWTISRYTGNNISAFFVGDTGDVIISNVNIRMYGVRPSFYLSSSVKLNGEGDGSKTNPYRITYE